MQLIITDNFTVARLVADALGYTPDTQSRLPAGKLPRYQNQQRQERSKQQSKAGKFVTKQSVITWCDGWVSGLVPPEDYSEKLEGDDPGRLKNTHTVLADLPILPKPWKRRLKPERQQQLRLIRQCLDQASNIVHAGRCNREGQAIIDDLLILCENEKPVSRLWLHSLDAVSIRQSLRRLQPNERFFPLRQAAIARIHADWLVQTNVSRALSYSIPTHSFNNEEPSGLSSSRPLDTPNNATATVGRLQSVVLSRIAAQDRKFENHKVTIRQFLDITLRYKGVSLCARRAWKQVTQAKLGESFPTAQLPTHTSVSKTERARYLNQWATISDVIREKSSSAVIPPATLGSLVQQAAAKNGFSAKAVQDALMALYEDHQLITYPLTDNPVLPDTMLDRAGITLAMLKRFIPSLKKQIDRADIRIRSPHWSQVSGTTHHAICPTSHLAELPPLNTAETVLYRLVVQAYISQFYTAAESVSTTIHFLIAGDCFITRLEQLVSRGWRAVAGPVEAVKNLPDFEVGTLGECIELSRKSIRDSTPVRFTEGSLYQNLLYTDALSLAVEEASAEDTLTELGTAETRALIIEDLKFRKLIELQGKHLVCTAYGRKLLDFLPEQMKDVKHALDTESALTRLASGSGIFTAFMTSQERFVKSQVEQLATTDSTQSGGGASQPSNTFDTLQHHCSACGKSLIRRKGRKPGDYWYSCSGYPECRMTWSDDKGSPSTRSNSSESTTYSCEVCGSALVKRASRKEPAKHSRRASNPVKESVNQRYWFGCSAYPDCKRTYACINGKPVINPENRSNPPSHHKCSQCGRPLVRLRGHGRGRRKGRFFWGCTGYPTQCTATRRDIGGVPEF